VRTLSDVEILQIISKVLGKRVQLWAFERDDWFDYGNVYIEVGRE